jgi:hypothetical protein
MINEREEELLRAREVAVARFYLEQKQKRKEDKELTYVIFTGLVVLTAIMMAGVAV